MTVCALMCVCVCVCVRSKVEYYVRLETEPECYFSYSTHSNALTGLLYWLVYANKLCRFYLAIELELSDIDILYTIQYFSVILWYN